MDIMFARDRAGINKNIFTWKKLLFIQLI
jgi:hypothetical protein